MRFRIGGLPCFAPSGEPVPLAALARAAQRDLRAAPPAPLPPGAGPAAQQHPAAPGSTQPQAPLQQVSGVEQPLQQPGQQQASPGPLWVWESPEYEIQSLDELQRFPIPPTLCIGGYLRVELLGKRQRQAADDQFYGERLRLGAALMRALSCPLLPHTCQACAQLQDLQQLACQAGWQPWGHLLLP